MLICLSMHFLYVRTNVFVTCADPKMPLVRAGLQVTHYYIKNVLSYLCFKLIDPSYFETATRQIMFFFSFVFVVVCFYVKIRVTENIVFDVFK